MKDHLELLQEKMKESVQGLKLVTNFRLKHFPEDLQSNFHSWQGFVVVVAHQNP